MAKAFLPSSANTRSSPVVLVQPTSAGPVASYLHDSLPLSVELSPIREQDAQPDIDGRSKDPNEFAEASSSLYEKSPWDSKAILSLDGGGVRGLYSLYILQFLMSVIEELERHGDDKSRSSSYSPLFKSVATNDDNTYLPCHYFDYIAGTSTGGLIAIMLGRLRMSVDRSIEAYKDLSESIFRNPTNRLARWWLLGHKRVPRQRKLKQKFEKLSGDEEEGQRFVSETRDQCQTIVCTLKKSSDDALAPYLFTSYEISGNFPSGRVDSDESTVSGQNELRHSSLKDVRTSAAAQAAAAAPSFRKPVKQESDGNIYHDAAWTFSNPSWVIYKEIAEEQSQKLDCLVSIGCGRAKTKRPTNLWRSRLYRIGDSTKLDRDLKTRADDQGFQYYRLDVEHEEERVRLDEWKPKSSGEATIQKIRGATEKYLQQKHIETECRTLAELLVQKRVQRARTIRWELFASGTWYVCPEKNCPDQNPRFEHRNALLDHLRAVHGFAPLDSEHYRAIQDRLNDGRKKVGPR